MRVNDDYPTWNAEQQLGDESSVLSFWTKALAIRKEYPLLVRVSVLHFSTTTYVNMQILGEFELILPDHPHVIAYKRKHGSAEALTLLNFSNADVVLSVGDEEKGKGWRFVLGNYTDVHDTTSHDLRPYEGRVYVLGG